MLLWASLKVLSSQIQPMSSFLPTNSTNHILFSVSVPVMKFQIHWTFTPSFLLFLEILCHPWNHFLVYVECSWAVSLSREAMIHRKAMLHFSTSTQNLYHVTHLATNSALTNAWILWVQLNKTPLQLQKSSFSYCALFYKQEFFIHKCVIR